MPGMSIVTLDNRLSSEGLAGGESVNTLLSFIMPSRPPLALDATARRFLDEHTYTNAWHDASEECPICHEPYLSKLEQRMQIIGITGCTHSFGLDCLYQYLSIDPQNAKKCPLCRTDWLPSIDSNPRRTRSSRRGARGLHSVTGNWQRLYAASLDARYDLAAQTGPVQHISNIAQFVPLDAHSSEGVRGRL